MTATYYIDHREVQAVMRFQRLAAQARRANRKTKPTPKGKRK